LPEQHRERRARDGEERRVLLQPDVDGVRLRKEDQGPVPGQTEPDPQPRNPSDHGAPPSEDTAPPLPRDWYVAVCLAFVLPAVFVDPSRAPVEFFADLPRSSRG